MMRAEAYGSADLQILAVRMDDAVSDVVVTSAATLLTQIRRNASTGTHRPGLPHIPGTGPGPNVATGDYRRSWNLKTGTDGAGRPAAVVSTNAAQGPRLEYGFTGTDSLGRSYAQPPYPHVRPAVEQLRPAFEAAVRDAVAQATRSPR